VGVNTLLLSSDPSNKNLKSTPSALSSLTKGVSDHQSPFRILVRTTTSFPQTAPIVDANFYPVTWRDQRHPFFYVLTCKTRKTRRELAGEASSDGQVSPLFVRR
jgi:hypothetical protein